MKISSSRRVSYSVFGFSLIIISINLLSLFFPALLLSKSIESYSEINPYEFGAWTIPFLLINFSILAVWILYYKQLLPNAITKSFKVVLNFEVSRKIATIVFVILIGVYIALTAGELNQLEEDVWADWMILGPIIKNFPYGVDETPGLNSLYVKNFLLYSSEVVFLNVKIIPLMGSLSLIVLVYFLTVKISKKRFAGLVAMIILLQSQTFLRYDTSATFSNFWTSFYLLSLYLIYKKWPLSPPAFVASIFSKALTITFLPMTLFFIFRSRISKKSKISLTISYLVILVVVIGALFMIEDVGFGQTITSFDFVDFLSGFTAWAFQLRIDGLILVFLLPLSIALFFIALRRNREADSILVLIGGVLLSMPLLSGFTEFNIQPYRWMPLIAFFAIGVGVLLSKPSIGRSED